jgi:DNA (cytosine-5)-methyltransferase 1
VVVERTCGGLFAGIGGLELGLERAGFRSLWMAEKDPVRRRVLHDQFPDVEVFDDVRGVNGKSAARVDLVAAGFPCTNVSLAGDGSGLDGPESGLWREVIRVVRDLRPRYLFVENVAALLGRGLDRVLGDLAESGFDAEWDCIPAAAVGAPHLRDRIWLVAYADDAGRGEQRRPEPAREERPAAQRRRRRTSSRLRGAS